MPFADDILLIEELRLVVKIEIIGLLLKSKA